jgi:hypothetical protein
MPILGLKVDELTDVNDLLEQKRITEKQVEALRVGREEANAKRRAEAVAKIEAAKQVLAAQGQQFVSPGRFAQIAGVARSTLRDLGYGYGGRWIRLADFPAAVSLEMYIALISNPANHAPELKAVLQKE